MCKYLPKDSGSPKPGVTRQLANVTRQAGHGHCRGVWTVHHAFSVGTLWSHQHQKIFTACYHTILQLSCFPEALV